jgi:hypothetical protein
MIKLKHLLAEQLIGMALSNAGNATRINLQKGSSSFSGKTPSTEDGLDAVDLSAGAAMAKRDPQEAVKLTMRKARLLKRPVTTQSRNIAAQMHALIQGIGGNSKIPTIIRKVPDIATLSSIITSYQNMYSRSLYQDLASEWNISWSSLWSAMKHINPDADRNNDFFTAA